MTVLLTVHAKWNTQIYCDSTWHLFCNNVYTAHVIFPYIDIPILLTYAHSLFFNNVSKYRPKVNKRRIYLFTFSHTTSEKKSPYLPDLVMTISVPYLWNCSQSSLCSSVTFGSSWTPLSPPSPPAAAGGGMCRGLRPPGPKGKPDGKRGKRPG